MDMDRVMNVLLHFLCLGTETLIGFLHVLFCIFTSIGNRAHFQLHRNKFLECFIICQFCHCFFQSGQGGLGKSFGADQRDKHLDRLIPALLLQCRNVGEILELRRCNQPGRCRGGKQGQFLRHIAKKDRTQSGPDQHGHREPLK